MCLEYIGREQQEKDAPIQKQNNRRSKLDKKANDETWIDRSYFVPNPFGSSSLQPSNEVSSIKYVVVGSFTEKKTLIYFFAIYWQNLPYFDLQKKKTEIIRKTFTSFSFQPYIRTTC